MIARLRSTRLYLLVASCSLLVGVQTVFKSGVHLVHLDVSVLDRDRQPVRGLTAADFTVLEDGKTQKIAAFAAVDVQHRRRIVSVARRAPPTIAS